jgi:hypothetical protein
MAMHLEIGLGMLQAAMPTDHGQRIDLERTALGGWWAKKKIFILYICTYGAVMIKRLSIEDSD